MPACSRPNSEGLAENICICQITAFMPVPKSACVNSSTESNSSSLQLQTPHLEQVRARFPGRCTPACLFFRRLPNFAHYCQFLAPRARSAVSSCAAPLLPIPPAAPDPARGAARSGDAMARYLPALPCASLRPRWRPSTSRGPGWGRRGAGARRRGRGSGGPGGSGRCRPRRAGPGRGRMSGSSRSRAAGPAPGSRAGRAGTERACPGCRGRRARAGLRGPAAAAAAAAAPGEAAAEPGAGSSTAHTAGRSCLWAGAAGRQLLAWGTGGTSHTFGLPGPFIQCFAWVLIFNPELTIIWTGGPEKHPFTGTSSPWPLFPTPFTFPLYLFSFLQTCKNAFIP